MIMMIPDSNKNQKSSGVTLTILPHLGGHAGGYFARRSIQTWYKDLKKPKWTPPYWAYAPIWTSLYTGMGYASYLVFKEGGKLNGPAKLPLLMYGGQLALNWAFTPIFCGLKNIKLAFYEILLLDAAAVTTGVMFYQVNKTAGLLFIPYCLWLSLASAIMFRIYKDNGDQIEEQINKDE